MVDGFFLSEDQMNQIMAVMESEMKLGLSRNPEDRKKSSLQMENTFVHETMDGTGVCLYSPSYQLDSCSASTCQASSSRCR